MNNIVLTFVCLSFQCLHARTDIYSGRLRKPKLQTCTSSMECHKRMCCRDNDRNLVGVEDLGVAAILGIGTCSKLKSGPGEVCLDQCGCKRGYMCYRTVSGVCCPPKTCWERKKALADKEFWDNCRPPTCFFPPSANPSNGKQGGL
ncbi:uncharacterized protein LOC132760553 [Ruditapes philippinarum]|uniref:uncharacterized protein LOC132760553 n=1 Tax=Ruditapes philippinarum TaxID=129788 RepID=UPI00295AF7A3|nr:uncharacterized protein LOC132760553 [Ruditapes philippinarum]